MTHEEAIAKVRQIFGDDEGGAEYRYCGHDRVYTVGRWIVNGNKRKWVIEGIDDQSWEGAFASAAMRKAE